MAVKNKTTVYFGSIQGHLLELSMEKPEPLFKSIKRHFKENDLDGLLLCPSMIAAAKNMYAVNAPVDIKIVLKPSGTAYSYVVVKKGQDVELGKWQTKEGKNVAQWLGDGLCHFFAEESTIMTILPPYYHTNKIYGISGSFDCGKWFRGVSFASRYSDEPIEIKAGEPMAYVRFDKPVDLQRVTITDSLRRDSMACLDMKNAHRNKPLSYLYDKFIQARKRERVLKQLREQID